MTQTNNYSPLYKRADKNNIYATLLIIITLGITFFVLSDLYSSYNQYNEEVASLKIKEKSLNEELMTLNEKKNKVKNDKKTQQLIAQYASPYREDIILNQIYAKFDGVNINDISMDKGQKLPNGLSMANIGFSIDAKNIVELNKYLEYLTDKTSNVRFIIKNAAFPLNSENQNSTTQASLSLGMYYFENN
ncbi:MAG: hypothetical protein PHZ26_00980 [Candidatus Gracilibacteria bacterium]|nr:hypothetical protein [Candidatus Gracilibacteria bacterium]MDD2908308.1 hypothetical protein [Candidatus Gracilibacteria bacterium]